MPSAFYTNKRTLAMQTQQQNPTRIGFPPFLIRFTRVVLNPMAAIAITIKA